MDFVRESLGRDAAWSTTHPDVQTPRPAPISAQKQVNVTERAQPTPYLQPVVPYIPPAEQAPPRVGWTVFWLGLVLGIVLFVINGLLLFAPYSFVLVGVVVYFLLSFISGWWITQRTGVFRASISTALWLVFWALCGSIIFTLLIGSGHPSIFLSLAGVMLIGIVVSMLGGVVGTIIYRSRQKIHPPAGGSITR